MLLADLVRYLDDYLRVRAVPDAPEALNGLQVENAGAVTRTAAAVDLCDATVRLAAEQGADLLLVHHGLFWRGLGPISGPAYRRIAGLIRHNIVVCTREALQEKLTAVLGMVPRVMPFGPGEVRRVGIVTGAAGSMIGQAAAAGLDTFITGEGAHHTFFDAEELGLNVFYAGHYATETLGVKALGEHLSAKFGLPGTFVDHPTGL